MENLFSSNSILDFFTPIANNLDDKIVHWVINHGVSIVIILTSAILLIKLVDAGIGDTVKWFTTPDALERSGGELQRKTTLIRVFRGIFKTIIWIASFIIISNEAGVNVTPFLAAAGAAGIAIGFGGQYLARDLITGFFLLLENQFRVGDYVCFEKTCGYVENITLRMTTLRDFDGTVYHVPNGSVSRTSNYSKGYARVFLDFIVSYDNDLQHVVMMINRVGDELFNDPVWNRLMISAPHFLRVDNFTEPGMTLKIIGATQPGKQWDITGELRRRLKIAADAEGIVLPRNLGYYTMTPPESAPAFHGDHSPKAVRKERVRKAPSKKDEVTSDQA